LYKSCRIPAAYQVLGLIYIIHEHNLLQPMTASCCGACPRSHYDVIN